MMASTEAETQEEDPNYMDKEVLVDGQSES